VKSQPIKNREEWLTVLAAVFALPHILKEADRKKPKHGLRISCGFPKGSRGGKSGHAIGQCWAHQASGDGTTEIFISPELTAPAAAAVLVHELIHYVVGVDQGHKGSFPKVAKAAGLEGRMRATVPGERLKTEIAMWLLKMKPYPHAPLTVAEGKKVGPGSRMVKVFCPDCDYTLRTTAKWIEVGVPKCPNPDCADTDLTMMVEGA
jgi:hypothetical protein